MLCLIYFIIERVKIHVPLIFNYFMGVTLLIVLQEVWRIIHVFQLDIDCLLKGLIHRVLSDILINLWSANLCDNLSVDCSLGSSTTDEFNCCNTSSNYKATHHNTPNNFTSIASLHIKVSNGESIWFLFLNRIWLDTANWKIHLLSS